MGHIVQSFLSSRGIKPKGVIQIGSHFGEEYPIWRGMGIPSIHFEPIESNRATFLAIHPEAIIYPYALGNKTGRINFYTETSNQSQSGSILAPKDHLRVLPHIIFNGCQQVEIRRLSKEDFPEIDFSLYDMIYMDVQGYEAEVIAGATPLLQTGSIRHIFCEINGTEMYEGCAIVGQFDTLMSRFGYDRMDTVWYDGGAWGDALYALTTPP